MFIVRGNGVWLSLVERYVRDVEVASSNLVTPIRKGVVKKLLKGKKLWTHSIACVSIAF